MDMVDEKAKARLPADVAGLVERLSELVRHGNENRISIVSVAVDLVDNTASALQAQAAEIERLEAKLREAVEVIRHYKTKWCAPEDGSPNCGEFDEHSCGGCKAHAFLAAMEKQNA